ncbi:MAG: ATP-binding protein [Chloroflexota bacterium]|nr:ATP-binding protein [Caldilineaceae bacterium]MDE0455171.1 ATP-binding protein [Gammaproteobacteria bacterium]MDE2839859.1 ATP-binding protein [Chloroflexota bacterium]
MAKQETQPHADVLRFSVDSQLMGELGERLVTRNHVALAELVKNAYDADASKITIEFCDYQEEGEEELFPSIVLHDNGHGMRFTDVDAHWMRIATANKVRHPVTLTYGRPKTGNKGIGRFACQRLASELVLTTVAKVGKNYERTKVFFQWADFTTGTTLTNIPCKYKTETVASDTPGTTLELIGLKDEWLQRDFNTLRRSISWLTMAREVRRKGFEIDPGFAIELRAVEFEEGEGLILDQLVDAGWGRLLGEVLSDGRASLKLSGNYLSGTKTWISDAQFPSLAGVSCDISYFTSGESYPLIRNKRILTKSVLANLREEAGVRVYYEAFRVFPMGERGDDWLGLDRDAAARRGSFSNTRLNEIASRLGLDHKTAQLRPRNENLLGKVHIDGAAGRALQIKMNREGFVETESLHELVRFVRLAIEWMTIYYAQARNRYERNKAKVAEREFLEELRALDNSKIVLKNQSSSAVVVTALDFLAGRTSDALSRKPMQEPDKRAVQRAEQVIETRIQELDSELGILRTLASTAPLLFTFAHEVSALIGRLSSDALRINAMAKHLPGKQKREALTIVESMRETAKNFIQMSELFGIVTSARQSKPRRLYVHKLLEKVVAGARFSTIEAGIKVQVCCSPELKSPRMFEAEVLSIIVNLYSNAIKSCLAAQQRNIKIQISAQERGADFVLEIRDQGVGLPKEYWSEAFEPFCSDPADQIYSKLEARIGTTKVSALGRGSGLGLSIVKGICDDYGGAASISKPDAWSLAVSVKLPLKKK